MSSLEIHPFALDYPPHKDEDVEKVAKNMRDHGFDSRFPIILFQGKMLDGCLRSLAAEKAGVQPDYLPFEGTEEAARLFVVTANEHRRHLTQEWLSQKRGERMGRAVDARANGESFRAIAEREGVSHKTIAEDIKKASGVTQVTPEQLQSANGVAKHEENESSPGPPEEEEEKVTGKDGKKYPKKPKKKRSQNGKPAVSTAADKKVADLMGKLARAIDDRAAATSKGKMYRACRDAMDGLSEAWAAWLTEQK